LYQLCSNISHHFAGEILAITIAVADVVGCRDPSFLPHVLNKIRAENCLSYKAVSTSVGKVGIREVPAPGMPLIHRIGSL
jgi:hypothetical protein